MERTFDRLIEFDERSRSFPIKTVIPAGAVPQYKIWSVGALLNQGADGACVGFSWCGELSASPVRVKGVDNTYAKNYYFDAQKLDPWPGGAYPGAEPFYEGTSVLAGAKVAKNRDFITSYRWCFSLNDLLLALSYEGPVVLGLNWYEGMMNVDSKGFIRPTGEMVGGHAIMARGLSVYYERVTLRNSWGAWGRAGSGECYISFDDLERLLGQDGEACVPIGRSL